jgi:hypothetical protein
MKLIIRKTHKYLSFFISLQLLLWTISGIYFAFNKIENVRGEQYRNTIVSNFKVDNLNLDLNNVGEISIKKRLDQNIIIIRTASGNKYLDESGVGINKLSKDQVIEIVKNNTSLKPYLVEEVIEDKRGSEYRGRKLPIYRVITKNSKDKDINVYVDPYSGEILSIRSKQWRIWDLMWGFHIMDWVDRDNIDNILLKIFSILALISSVTGLLIFFKVDWSSG